MTSEHLKDNRRHNIITASQIWSSLYERQKLWREKTLREPPFEGNDATQYGNDHEHIALSAFELHMDDICQSGNRLIVHDSLPFGASPDAFLNTILEKLNSKKFKEDEYYCKARKSILNNNKK